jgi:hypothetical protein
MKRSEPQPKPISIPGDLAVRCDGPDQFDKFDTLFRNVISVSKAKSDAEEAKWKRQQAKKHPPKP